MSSRERVEKLNAFLMIASCAAAFAAPFHLFLAAYAILGPLHYLTEISWLHDRDYFAPRSRARKWWLLLVGLAMTALLYGYVSNDLLHRPVSPALEIGMMYLVLLTAALLLWVKHPVNAVALAILGMAGLALVSGARAYALLAYFIITIIHVLVFTVAFIVHGALRSRSRWSVISLIVFGSCIAALLAVELRPGLGASARIHLLYSFFEPLNVQLIALFHRSGDLYESRAGLAVMRLIAFAYTYHYLNWFSKTSIIRWHDVPRRRFVAIVAAWVLALAVYAYDYRVGVSLLYMLSLLHVLLEFPLNHRTFAGIAAELRGTVRA
jgi:hypothetical protein